MELESHYKRAGDSACVACRHNASIRTRNLSYPVLKRPQRENSNYSWSQQTMLHIKKVTKRVWTRGYWRAEQRGQRDVREGAV